MSDKMTLKEARRVTGHKAGLGKPSKMPGYSTAIPATACKTGARLAKIPGSVCASCYAMRGNYLYPSVREGLQKRLEAIKNPEWVDGMVRLISHYTDPADPHFRAHDSGDLQGKDHLRKWIAIARQIPDVKIWLPSREIRDVKAVQRETEDWPANLVVRLSAPMMGRTLDVKGPTSSVDAGTGHRCPAYDQNGKCGSCRACWDPTVENVDYKKH